MCFALTHWRSLSALTDPLALAGEEVGIEKGRGKGEGKRGAEEG